MAFISSFYHPPIQFMMIEERVHNYKSLSVHKEVDGFFPPFAIHLFCV
jgi:hypothetical protein